VCNFWKREQSSLYSNVWRKSTRHALTWRGGTYDMYYFLFLSLSRKDIQWNVAKTQLGHTKYRNFSLSADLRKMMYVLFMKTNDALHPFLKFDARVFLPFFRKTEWCLATRSATQRCYVGRYTLAYVEDLTVLTSVDKFWKLVKAVTWPYYLQRELSLYFRHGGKICSIKFR
jgi:hypothetical protein